eukprot:10719200-Alexandrium_andersonii.AAC.1
MGLNSLLSCALPPPPSTPPASCCPPLEAPLAKEVPEHGIMDSPRPRDCLNEVGMDVLVAHLRVNGPAK